MTYTKHVSYDIWELLDQVPEFIDEVLNSATCQAMNFELWSQVDPFLSKSVNFWFDASFQWMKHVCKVLEFSGQVWNYYDQLKFAAVESHMPGQSRS